MCVCDAKVSNKNQRYDCHVRECWSNGTKKITRCHTRNRNEKSDAAIRKRLVRKPGVCGTQIRCALYRIVRNHLPSSPRNPFVHNPVPLVLHALVSLSHHPPSTRIRRPSFLFQGEAGYGPGVDSEAWEMIARDIVGPSTSSTPNTSSLDETSAQKSLGTSASAQGAAAVPNSQSYAFEEEVVVIEGGSGSGKIGIGKRSKPYFVPVDEGLSSYCPRDLRDGGDVDSGTGDVEEERMGGSGSRVAMGTGGDGSGKMTRYHECWREHDEDLRAFELVGLMIGASVVRNKVRGGVTERVRINVVKRRIRG